MKSISVQKNAESAAKLEIPVTFARLNSALGSLALGRSMEMGL